MIYQRHHHPPHEIWKWPKKARVFALASDLLAMKAEEKAAKN